MMKFLRVRTGRFHWNLPLVIGVVLLIWAAIRMGIVALEAWQVQDWPTAPGRVVSTGSESVSVFTRGGDGHRFIPDVRYTYEVDGRTYRNRRVYIGDPPQRSTTQRFEALMEESGFVTGATIPVHYDPANPANAVLRTEPRFDGSFPFLGLSIVSFFFGFVQRWEEG